MKKFFVSVVLETSDPVISKFTEYEKLIEFYASVCLSLASNKASVLVYDDTIYGGMGDLLIAAWINENTAYVTSGTEDDKRIINVTEKDTLKSDARKRLEIYQYEQAEVLNENADYRVYIGSHLFKFIGNDAADLVYKVLEGLFSSVCRDSGLITVDGEMTGVHFEIVYFKTLYKCTIKVNNGETLNFAYSNPSEVGKIMAHIRKEVIL